MKSWIIYNLKVIQGRALCNLFVYSVEVLIFHWTSENQEAYIGFIAQSQQIACDRKWRSFLFLHNRIYIIKILFKILLKQNILFCMGIILVSEKNWKIRSLRNYKNARESSDVKKLSKNCINSSKLDFKLEDGSE